MYSPQDMHLRKIPHTNYNSPNYWSSKFPSCPTVICNFFPFTVSWGLKIFLRHTAPYKKWGEAGFWSKIFQFLSYRKKCPPPSKRAMLRKFKTRRRSSHNSSRLRCEFSVIGSKDAGKILFFYETPSERWGKDAIRFTSTNDFVPTS